MSSEQLYTTADVALNCHLAVQHAFANRVANLRDASTQVDGWDIDFDLFGNDPLVNIPSIWEQLDSWINEEPLAANVSVPFAVDWCPPPMSQPNPHALQPNLPPSSPRTRLTVISDENKENVPPSLAAVVAAHEEDEDLAWFDGEVNWDDAIFNGLPEAAGSVIFGGMNENVEDDENEDVMSVVTDETW